MEQGKIIYPFAPDLQISPLSSLNFEHDWRRDFQTPCHYEQKFVRWDRIRVQYAATDRYSFKACITDNDTGTRPNSRRSKTASRARREKFTR